MIKKTITFTDWNGTTRTEDFYFNLTQTECVELEYSSGMGKSMSASINELVRNQDMAVMIKILKDIILKSYGEKSDDGRRFIKSEEISTAFSQTPVFDMLYMELATDADKAAEFINGIIPTDTAIRPKIVSNK